MIYRERGYLPHLESQDRSYFVTFHIADSLPKELLEAWKQEREDVPTRRIGFWVDKEGFGKKSTLIL